MASTQRTVGKGGSMTREEAVAAAVARHPSAIFKDQATRDTVVFRQLGLPGFADGKPQRVKVQT